SIEISNPPTKTAYKYGEVFSPAGMAVTARYTDGQSRAATGYTYSPTGALKLSDTTITVSYTEGDVTKTTTQAITVAKVLDRIAV
ncbi:bacterial Ig-like domain-containing protein, partial [Desulfovibrio desulfuricans]|nr:bacterial Ig-like domain-containing protein [Desulfovibrio desulfuricans]